MAQGIKQTGEIDLFFAVPIQAYQDMFTQSYARYLKDRDRRQQQTALRLISQLDHTQTVFVTVLATLMVIAALVWCGVTCLIVRPLSQIHQHLQRIAAGDLSQPLTPNDRTARTRSSPVEPEYHPDAIRASDIGRSSARGYENHAGPRCSGQ